MIAAGIKIDLDTHFGILEVANLKKVILVAKILCQEIETNLDGSAVVVNLPVIVHPQAVDVRV